MVVAGPRDPAVRSPQAIVGGLLASEPATLFLLPAIQSLIVRDQQGAQSQHSPADKQERDTGSRALIRLHSQFRDFGPDLGDLSCP